MELQIGDVVKLKSGGPWMTVEKIEGDAVSCIWFPDNNAAVTRSFHKEVLLKEA
jgi:uncharacterized protein YodC (DUF2158 family)